MDTMLSIVTGNNIRPDDIKEVVFYAGSNILNPIKYPIAHDELEAKFCVPITLMSFVIFTRSAIMVATG